MPEIAKNGAKNFLVAIWEQDAGGSSPFTPTKILTESRVYSPLSVVLLF